MDNDFQKTEQSQISQDIEKLGKEIAEKKFTPEIKNYSERDLIKQSIGQKLYPSVRQAQDKQAAPQRQISDDDKYLPDYLKNSAQEIKNSVKKLLENTIKHGLEKGISEARKMPPFIMDAYHDALVDKLHEELKRRKMI